MIILNEKEYVEEHYLKNNEVDAKPYNTLSLLARYYYHCLGYRQKKIESLLLDYLDRNYPRYVYSKYSWEETVERLARKAGKYPLLEADCIWITESELEKIEAIGNQKMELVIFTLLCLAKYYNLKKPKNNSWVNDDIKDVFDLARVSTSMENRDYMLYDLHQINLVDFPVQVGNLANRVTFVDDESKKVLPIKDFRELGREYLLYKGGNFIRCSGCGRLIPKKGNTRYCSKCSAERPAWKPEPIPEEDRVTTKEVICVDCGKIFTVSIKSNKACRCEECQKVYRSEYKKEKMRQKREQEKMLTLQN